MKLTLEPNRIYVVPLRNSGYGCHFCYWRRGVSCPACNTSGNEPDASRFPLLEVDIAEMDQPEINIERPKRSLVTSSRRKPRVSFNDEMDLALLREVASTNPFAAKHGNRTAAWKKIALSFKQNNAFRANLDWIDARRARERTDILVRKYEKTKAEGNRENEDDHSELTGLLENILEDVRRGKDVKENEDQPEIDFRFVAFTTKRKRDLEQFSPSDIDLEGSMNENNEGIEETPTNDTGNAMVQPHKQKDKMVKRSHDAAVQEILAANERQRQADQEFRDRLLKLEEKRLEYEKLRDMNFAENNRIAAENTKAARESLRILSETLKVLMQSQSKDPNPTEASASTARRPKRK